MGNTAKKVSLFDLVEQYRELIWHIEDNEGVIEDEWFEQLDALDGNIVDKVDRCLWVVDEFKAQAEVYSKRAKALADHANRLKDRGERLKDYVRDSLERLGVDKLQTPSYSAVALRKTPASVEILDEDRFVKKHSGTSYIRVVESPNKAQIKEALKAGDKVWGAHLIDDRRHLVYK